jgi:hypothetical protein
MPLPQGRSPCTPTFNLLSENNALSLGIKGQDIGIQ